ncbi:hypothetical protein ABAC460_20925 [Asticcacaulis sp. AC460]|uniref:hypothetical protein n=1 Tax=Asticcacaulis sp. AC460 TaxID=1282360 RepID=UPI0003C3F690|nr:hypothetical protein [Asticcacaulis sp. AC460]ESQ87236.1 hypothetical protein ABAC460_20925 [Asticcacaulis sp. AC460]
MSEVPSFPQSRSSVRIVALFSLLLLGVTCGAATAPQPGRDLAVIVAPWSQRPDALVAISHAGGRITGAGRWSFIAFAAHDDSRLVSQLYASGAWLVIDAGGLAACQSPSSGA